MNIEQRLEEGEAINNKGTQRAVNGNSQENQLRLVDLGRTERIDSWQKITCEGAAVRPDPDQVQDTEEAEALNQRRRKMIAGILIEALNRRQLTESHFYRITRRDETYWTKWLAFQLRNDRLVLKDKIYRPGPQWAIALVSMR